MLSAGSAQSPQPIPQLTAASSAAVTQGNSQPASPAPLGRISRGKRRGKSAAGSPVPMGQAPSGPTVPAAGLKRKADQLQGDARLQVKFLVLQCLVAVGIVLLVSSHQERAAAPGESWLFDDSTRFVSSMQVVFPNCVLGPRQRAGGGVG